MNKYNFVSNSKLSIVAAALRWHYPEQVQGLMKYHLSAENGTPSKIYFNNSIVQDL